MLIASLNVANSYLLIECGLFLRANVWDGNKRSFSSSDSDSVSCNFFVFEKALRQLFFILHIWSYRLTFASSRYMWYYKKRRATVSWFAC